MENNFDRQFSNGNPGNTGAPNQFPYQNQNPYQNPNPNPYQNQNPYQNPNPNPYQSQNPYQNPNPNPYQNQNPYQNPNPNPYQSQNPYQNPNPNPYQSQNPYQNPNGPYQGNPPFYGPPPKVVTDYDIDRIKQRRIIMLVLTALIYIFIGSIVFVVNNFGSNSPAFVLFIFLTLLTGIVDYALMGSMFSIMKDNENTAAIIIIVVLFFGIALPFAFISAIFTYVRSSKYLTAAKYF